MRRLLAGFGVAVCAFALAVALTNWHPWCYTLDDDDPMWWVLGCWYDPPPPNPNA